MYSFSKLTEKTFDSKFVEVLIDGNNPAYVEYESWLLAGNQPAIIEGTPNEILESKQKQVEEIKTIYKEKISRLVSPYVEKFIIEAIPIPQNILDEREFLKQECNFKLQELSPSSTMDKPPFPDIEIIKK